MSESLGIAVSAALSALGGDMQHNRLMRLEFPYQDGPQTAILLVNTLHAHEEVSRSFRFDVEVLSDDARIPLKVMMAKMVTISLVREDGSLRYFNGYVTEFRFLRTDGGFAFYHMVLEPWLAFARLRKDSVSFHEKSVREITEETLKHYRQADCRQPVQRNRLQPPAPALGSAWAALLVRAQIRRPHADAVGPELAGRADRRHHA
jgi:type VI secretion system secreted protein VgrG